MPEDQQDIETRLLASQSQLLQVDEASQSAEGELAEIQEVRLALSGRVVLGEVSPAELTGVDADLARLEAVIDGGRWAARPTVSKLRGPRIGVSARMRWADARIFSADPPKIRTIERGLLEAAAQIVPHISGSEV